MNMKEFYSSWARLIKDTTPLEKGKFFKEFPMQPATDQIYYITFNYKVEPKVEMVDLTIKLKHKKTMENE